MSRSAQRWQDLRTRSRRRRGWGQTTSSAGAERDDKNGDGSIAAVLVVDDSPDARSAIADVLSASSYCRLVGEADSGEEAVRLVDELLPDLVLLDIMMPGIGGIEAARQITERRPRTVVVLVSAYPEAQLPSSARSSGAVEILAKEQLSPAEVDELWVALRPKRGS